MRTSHAAGRWRRWGILGSLTSTIAIGIVSAQAPQAPQKAQPLPPQAPPIQVRVGAGQVLINGRVGMIGQIGNDPSRDNNNQRVRLPIDPRARRKVEEAKRFIDTQDWQSAVKILQSLLDASEDNFLQESDSDKGRRVSVRAEANRLLGSLPPEGKRFYEQQFGSVAKLALKQAKTQANPQQLAEVALKYVHTQAGAEAAAWLGSYHLDHGRYIVAALCFERLLGRDGVANDLSMQTLYKAAIAFERSGDAANRDKAWSFLQAKLKNSSERLPGPVRSWDEEKLRTSLKASNTSRLMVSQYEWRLFMGSPDRTARSSSTSPFMEPMFPPIATSEPGQARLEIENASKKLASMGIPVIQGFHPLIVRDLVVYRTVEGIAAINLKTGALEWESKSDVSFAAALRAQNNADPETHSYLSTYRESASSLIIENTLLGTLSADNDFVYSVEDTAIPPNVQTSGVTWRGNFNRNPQMGSRQGDYSSCNHLIAYHIDGGRVAWSIGTPKPNQPFSEMYFLGPPLPLGDKLYVLAEVGAEIKLLCLQNTKTPKANSPDEFDYLAELVWSQPLGVVDRKLLEDPVRRSQAATLAYSDGILVCPTNAGAVIGVDLLTRTLVWAFNYQNETVVTDSNEIDRVPNFRVLGRMPRGVEAPTRGSQWSYSAPVIAQGKVLLAPPDGDALHVINLRDGTLAWSASRVDTSKDPLPPDSYLGGVFDNAVILAGKQNVHALDLQTGKRLWNAETGIPVGRGIANDDTYFLPTKNNEIVSVSLKTGAITARHKARHKEQLGNLALVGEHLVSLNHQHLLVYPIQLVKERQVAERLKANPRDPGALIDRGEIRWQANDVEGAMNDYRAGLASNPSLEIKFKGEAKLTDTLMSVLEKDFKQHEKLVPELEKMTTAVSKEGLSGEEKTSLQDRQARFYRLMASGRETQGRIAEALGHLHAFAQLDDKLISSPDDPLVRVQPKVWALAQAEAMTKRLKPELRASFDEAIERQWQAIQKEKSPEAYKAFVEFYGTLNTTGNQAQLQFIETLIEKKRYSEAVLWLLPLLDVPQPVMAGKAYDMLARLNIRLNEMENAAYFYRIMAKKYPDVVIRDGKTGKQLYQELQTDKRFLPYLDDRQGLSNLQQFSIDKMQLTRHGGNNQLQYTANFLPSEEPPPHLRRFSLQVLTDANSTFRSTYIVRDLVEKKELINNWNFAYPTMNFGGMRNQERMWPTVKYCGNVMVFAWSNRIVGYDPIKKKEVWTFNVMGESATDDSNNNNLGIQTYPSREIPGRFEKILPTNSFELMGTYGPGSAERLVMTIKNEGLVCINPQTGARLWSRYGVSPSIEMFGDEEYVILIPSKVGRRPEDQITAIRLLDGAIVPVKREIASDFRSALARSGRHLLIKQTAKNGSEQLGLVDPLTGENVWTKALPADAILLKSQQSDLIGFASREGEVQLLNLQTGSVVLRCKLRPLTGKFEQANVVIDENECYLFFCKSMEVKPPSILRWAGIDVGEMDSYALVEQFQWLRSVPVHGPAACIDKANGQVIWQENLRLQYVVTQRFQELPFLLCSSVTRKLTEADRAMRNANPNNINVNMMLNRQKGNQLQNEMHCLSKQTGKLIAVNDKPDFDGYYDRVTSNIGFQELLIDQHSGKVELKSPMQTLSFTLVAEAMTAGKKRGE